MDRCIIIHAIDNQLERLYQVLTDAGEITGEEYIRLATPLQQLLIKYADGDSNATNSIL